MTDAEVTMDGNDADQLMRIRTLARRLQSLGGGLALVLGAPYYWFYAKAADLDPMDGSRLWRLMGLVHAVVGTTVGTLLCLAIGLAGVAVTALQWSSPADSARS